MDLEQAQELANKLIQQYLPNTGQDLPWVFAWDNARRRFGCCKYRWRTITLSKVLTPGRSESSVRNTILHEIAHALTPGHGHDVVWKCKCLAIGCKPERVCHEDVAMTYKYLGICPACGDAARRHRRTDVSCGLCDPKGYNDNFKIVWQAL